MGRRWEGAIGGGVVIRAFGEGVLKGTIPSRSLGEGSVIDGGNDEDGTEMPPLLFRRFKLGLRSKVVSHIWSAVWGSGSTRRGPFERGQERVRGSKLLAMAAVSDAGS